MSHSLSSLAVVAFAALVGAQIPAGRTAVLTRNAGVAQVLTVDGTGAIATFGTFPSASLPPLAIEVDPIDRHALVAVDLGGGVSRVLRLLPGPGATFAGELVLADLPGPCAQLAVAGDELLAVVGGANGGLYRLPRRGGAPTLLRVRTGASALYLFGFGRAGQLGWSAATASAAPGLEQYDDNGALVAGPFPFPNLPGRQLTGLVDLPTALSRQLVAFADGTFAMHVQGLGNPTPLALTGAPPSGGAVALKSEGFYALTGLGLGGAAFPNLYRVDPFALTVTVLAGPLPGDPVDFALAPAAFPSVAAFGTACGAPALQLQTGVMGPPQLGNSSFDIRVFNAVPSQLIFFVAGFRDVDGALLPAPLPGGCTLHVGPDIALAQIANIGGGARQNIAIPAQPALAGTLLFAQWLQPQGNGFAASAAVAASIQP